MLKRIIQNLILVLIGCIIAFLLIEMILRISNPFSFTVKGDKIILEANVEYTINNDSNDKLDKTIHYRKNSLGFRGVEPPNNFKDYLSIITVGGSTTECTQLSEGKTWVDLLGKKMELSFNPFWINNAGLEGHSSYGHKILMRDYITKTNPKIVLFLIGANDVAKKDFNVDKEIIIKGFQLNTLRGALVSLANHSEVFALALNLWRYIRAEVLGLVHENLNLNEIGSLDIPDKTMAEILNSHKEGLLRNYKKRLNEIIKISRNNSIEPVFITQPALFGKAIDDITKANLGKIKTGNNHNGELDWLILELYNDVLRETGRGNNVLVIDLASKMPKSSLYYYDLWHFTNQGAEKVSDIIYNELCSFISTEYSQYKTNNCK